MAERKLNDWLESYLEFTRNSEAPYIYRLWCGVSMLSAALERKVWFEWEKRQFPNMYIVLVGHSGMRKGTAIHPAERILRRITPIHLASETTTREGLIKEMRLAMDHSRVPRVPPHCSLTVFSEELTVFLGYQNVQLMMDLTAWFDCKEEWKYNTKDDSLKEALVGVWLNLLGATTPKMIAASMPPDAVGAGLTSRMIFVYEDQPGKDVIFPFRTKEEGELEKLLEDDLADIQHEIDGVMQFSEEMLKSYAKWRVSDGKTKRFMGTMLEAYTTRRPIHHLKLACILSISRSSEKVIELQDWEKAISILKQTETKMPKTFEGVGENPDAPAMLKIVQALYANGKLLLSEIIELVQYDMPRQRIIDTVNTLEATHKVRKDYDEGSKDDFIVHWVYKKEEQSDNR